MAQTHFASLASKEQLSICYLFMRPEVFSTLIIHITVFLGYDNIRFGWYVTLWVNVMPSSSVQKAYSCGHTLLPKLLETTYQSIWCHNPEDYRKNKFETVTIIIIIMRITMCK